MKKSSEWAMNEQEPPEKRLAFLEKAGIAVRHPQG